MGDTPKTPDPSGQGDVDVTSKKPPGSGPVSSEIGGGDTQKVSDPGSRTQGGTLKKGAGSKSRLDDIPEEALQYAEDPARQLGQYLLVKQIGKGGMGAVWKAWDKKLTRWVAIKFLLVSDDEDVARFQREAKLAARMRHPNIAPIYEVGEAPAQALGQSARHYLAMEYIDGQSLGQALNLPMSELLDLFAKIASGIEAAHKAGVVHRDLKPQNVMLTSDKWPYVMDFGLAKALQTESSLSVSGAVMGTPAYMPPEQAQGQLDQIDAQSDVYSLGATMYAVLCRKQPFTGQTPMEILMKVCKDDPVAPRTHNPEIPEAVEQILLKCLAKTKSDRYASAQALCDDLKRVLSNQEIEARGPSSLKLAVRKAKRNVWPLVVGLIVLVAGGTIGFLVLNKPKPPPVVVNPVPAPQPLPQIPLPAPAPNTVAADKADRWNNEWLKLRNVLQYQYWKPGDATLSAKVNAHLSALMTDAPYKEGEVGDWFNEQVEKAGGALQGLNGAAIEEKRATAAKIVGWCDTLVAAGKGIAAAQFATETAGPIRTRAAQIANFQGSFTLQIVVGPYAEVTKITRNGQEVPLAQRFTPLPIGNLEIGDYEIELSHPKHGKKVEKLAAKDLKNGKTYQIKGLMQEARLKVGELP